MKKINGFIKKTKPKNKEKRREKENAEQNLYYFYTGREWFLMALKVKYL